MSDLDAIIRRDLAIIRDSWPALLDLPHTPGSDKVDTTLASPTPLAITVLSLRFDTSMLLASWAHLVWDEQHLTTGLNLLDTIPITRFLDRHSRFLADHEIAAYAAAEIGYYAGLIVELVNQTKARRIKVGKCPDCEGALIAYIHQDCVPSDLRCTLHPEHTWEYGRWRWLGDRILA